MLLGRRSRRHPRGLEAITTRRNSPREREHLQGGRVRSTLRRTGNGAPGLTNLPVPSLASASLRPRSWTRATRRLVPGRAVSASFSISTVPESAFSTPVDTCGGHNTTAAAAGRPTWRLSTQASLPPVIRVARAATTEAIVYASARAREPARAEKSGRLALVVVWLAAAQGFADVPAVPVPGFYMALGVCAEEVEDSERSGRETPWLAHPQTSCS